MKEVHLSEEAMHLKLFNRMLKEIKQSIEMRAKNNPLEKQAMVEVYKLAFKENLIKRLVKYSLSKKNWSNGNKKFFVLGLRYKEILTSLPKAETLLITSSVREVLFCIFRGYNWIYIAHAEAILLKFFFEADTKSSRVLKLPLPDTAMKVGSSIALATPTMSLIFILDLPLAIV